MCGTNNIDQLIGVERKDYANIISSPQVPDQMLYETRCDIYNLVSYIHSWAQSASINIINILPRVSACRNAIINQLNSYIMHLVTICLMSTLWELKCTAACLAISMDTERNNFSAIRELIMSILIVLV